MVEFKHVRRQFEAANSAPRAMFLMLLLLAILPQQAEAVALCYQEDLDLVQRVLEQDCQGVVVSPEEAETIQARRQARLKKGFAGSSWRPQEGLRLAGVGSGFAVSAEGHLVTNHHVIDDCQAISGLTPQGEQATLNLLKSAASVDLALLRSSSGELARRPVLFSTPHPLVGSVTGTAGKPNAGAVYFLGYPNLGRPPLIPFERTGQIWQLIGDVLEAPVIAFRGEIRQGNSGGPLLNANDQVIGLVFAETMSRALRKEADKTTTLPESDIGLAVPHWEILLFLEEAGVAYRVALDPAEKSPKSDNFMLRVNCWR